MNTQPTWVSIAIAAIGMVGAVAAGAIGYQSGSNAVDKDYVALAISTLGNKDASPELRNWSVDVLSELSPVPFGAKLREELAADGLYHERLVFNRINVPAEIKQRCPDILKNAGPDVPLDVANSLLEEYQYCRIRMDSLIDLIDGYNQIIDEANAKSSAEAGGSTGTQSAAQAEEN